MTTDASSATQEMLRIFRPFWLGFVICIALGIVGGASVTALLATINDSLYDASSITQGIVLSFAGLCVLSLATSIASDIGTNYIGQHIIGSLRKDLGGRVLSAPIRQIENFRSHKLIPVLTHDVDTISSFAFAFAPLLISLTITLGCLGYLAMLSMPMFLVTLGAIVLGTLMVSIAQNYGYTGFLAARDEEDRLQKHYQSVVFGAKELRIDRSRRQQVYTSQLIATADRIRDIQIRAISIFITSRSLGSMLFFITIGVLLLAQQAFWPQVGQSVVSGFVLVLLYMKGPLEHLVDVLPIVSRARIAFSRIADLAAQFSSSEQHLLLPESAQTDQLDINSAVSSLELREVCYRYPETEGGETFSFGPVSAGIRQGDIVFIVGENGSGKTTLIKLLLGLYEPSSGEVLVNGKSITTQSRDSYRQLFSTVFADYFLFDELNRKLDVLPPDVDAYLQRLEIAHKVSIRDGTFTTTELSTGQRKRLALVHVWLSDRPVLVFDEWAADQDPVFRRIFYTELLPDLKRQGKTVIVISHDDRYFHVADSLLVLSAGKIVSHGNVAPATGPESVMRVLEAV